jgi:Fe-S cluster assembly protein SufD
MTLLPDNLLPAGWDGFGGVRADALGAARATSLPTEAEEVWRYSHIDELELDGLRLANGVAPAGTATGAGLSVLEAVGDAEARLAVDGGTAHWSGSDVVSMRSDAVDVAGADDRFEPLRLDDLDAFSLLNVALSPSVHTVEVPARAQLTQPVVVVNHGAGDGELAAARVRVAVGEAASATIVHVVASRPGRQVLVPVTELHVGQAAVVRLVTVHVLDEGTWALGRIVATAERDAAVELGSASFGGHYSRLRIDATLRGDHSSLQNRALYLGTGRSMHDYRVSQHHVGRATESRLTLRGAVRDTAEGVFTGVVRMENGAKSAAGDQDARHLILEDGGHVDSVPTLEIEENDVSCSHASSISPLDADQVFYLESRGVPTSEATRLITRGFLRAAQSGVAPERLAGAVGDMIASALAPVIEAPLIR